jgi:hypothetical protein
MLAGLGFEGVRGCNRLVVGRSHYPMNVDELPDTGIHYLHYLYHIAPNWYLGTVKPFNLPRLLNILSSVSLKATQICLASIAAV